LVFRNLRNNLVFRFKDYCLSLTWVFHSVIFLVARRIQYEKGKKWKRKEKKRKKRIHTLDICFLLWALGFLLSNGLSKCLVITRFSLKRSSLCRRKLTWLGIKEQPITCDCLVTKSVSLNRVLDSEWVLVLLVIRVGII